MPNDDREFDPLAILEALDRSRVAFVVIGSFARVIHGADEVPGSIDVTPSIRPENLSRLGRALESLSGDASATALLARPDTPVVPVPTRAGVVKLVHAPAGTGGYDDLRRRATREPLGAGVRAPVASVGDLIRMLAALNPSAQGERVDRLRRLAELDRERGITL